MNSTAEISEKQKIQEQYDLKEKYEETMNCVLSNIVRIRALASLTQKEFSKPLGILQPHWSKYETGVWPLRLTDVIKICLIFDINIATLCSAFDEETILKFAKKSKPKKKNEFSTYES